MGGRRWDPPAVPSPKTNVVVDIRCVDREKVSNLADLAAEYEMCEVSAALYEAAQESLDLGGGQCRMRLSTESLHEVAKLDGLIDYAYADSTVPWQRKIAGERDDVLKKILEAGKRHFSGGR